MPGATIGRGSTVAAGAVVLEHVHAPPFSLITGSPARIKPSYTDQDMCLARAAKHAHQYCARASVYRRSLREMLDHSEGTGCRQWEQGAWEEASARLGYPRLYLEGGNETTGDGFIFEHGLREASILPQPGTTNRSGGCEISEAPRVQEPKRPIGGGTANIIVAAIVGAVASVVVSALRKRCPS